MRDRSMRRHQPPSAKRFVPAAAPLIILIGALGGCASGDSAIFGPVDPGLAWPLPPATPRIFYVGQLESSADLKEGRSLGEVIFGADDSHSMLSPYAICTDAQERVFVADSNAQCVHVFDLRRRTYKSWAIAGADARLAQPVGIAWDDGPPRRLLVADSVAGTVFVFDDSGRFRGDLGGEYVQRPAGLAIDRARGRLIIADPGAHRIAVLDLNGRLIRHVGERGIEPGQFNFPTNVAVDRDGFLYVSDSLNFRVQVFDTDFRPAGQIGGYGDMPGYFSQPKGVAVSSAGHIYVVDAQFEAVQVFSRDGTLLLPFGHEGTGPGEFWLPAGIHIDRNDRIWIADTYNRRVQVFDYRAETDP